MAGDFLDDTHAAFHAFAEQFLDEDERDDFIDSMMERHGYERTQHWAAPQQQQRGQGGRAPLLKGKGAGGQRQQQGGQQQQQQQGGRSYFSKGGGR